MLISVYLSDFGDKLDVLDTDDNVVETIDYKKFKAIRTKINIVGICGSNTYQQFLSDYYSIHKLRDLDKVSESVVNKYFLAEDDFHNFLKLYDLYKKIDTNRIVTYGKDYLVICYKDNFIVTDTKTTIVTRISYMKNYANPANTRKAMVMKGYDAITTNIYISDQTYDRLLLDDKHTFVFVECCAINTLVVNGGDIIGAVPEGRKITVEKLIFNSGSDELLKKVLKLTKFCRSAFLDTRMIKFYDFYINNHINDDLQLFDGSKKIDYQIAVPKFDLKFVTDEEIDRYMRLKHLYTKSFLKANNADYQKYSFKAVLQNNYKNLKAKRSFDKLVLNRTSSENNPDVFYSRYGVRQTVNLLFEKYLGSYKELLNFLNSNKIFKDTLVIYTADERYDYGIGIDSMHIPNVINTVLKVEDATDIPIVADCFTTNSDDAKCMMNKLKIYMKALDFITKHKDELKKDGCTFKYSSWMATDNKIPLSVKTKEVLRKWNSVEECKDFITFSS